MNHHVIGIDSAPAGWITTLLSDDQHILYRLYESVEMLWGNHFDERYHLLFRYLSGFEKSYWFARDVWKKSQVTKDDLLDAAVLALAASSNGWHLMPLPDPPEYDDAGLPMQIIRPAGLVLGN